MKRLVALVAFAIVATVGVMELMEATQNRKDERRSGTVTLVDYRVSFKRWPSSEQSGAAALWAACQGTVTNRAATDAPEWLGGHRWRGTVVPAIGKNGKRRLEGCIEDGTLDRLNGRVEGMTFAVAAR